MSVRDIICEATIFYSHTVQHPNTFRLLFRMKDTIDGIATNHEIIWH